MRGDRAGVRGAPWVSAGNGCYRDDGTVRGYQLGALASDALADVDCPTDDGT